MSQKMMSQERYIRNRGLKCPFCGGRSLEAGKFDGFFQRVRCDDCGNEWDDVFKLIGYNEVK